jgi:ribonucleoside-diphosphate reductase alpha chain
MIIFSRLTHLLVIGREFDGSPSVLTVLEKRYLKKDKDGRVVETPEEMFWRVARGDC